MDTNAFIGLNLQEAKQLAAANNVQLRVAKQEGKMFLLSADFRTDRVNVEIEKGKIILAGIG